MIFFEIFLPHSKPILVGIFYRPPNNSEFIKTLHTAIEDAKDFNNQEVYFMGDMNINMDTENTTNNHLRNEYIDFAHHTAFRKL